MHQFHLLIPDPHAFPSGGNVYNAHLLQALIRAGAHVSHHAFEPELMLASPDTVYILDSIYFEKIDRPEVQIPSNCIGLIHHLKSLYPFSQEYFLQQELPILRRFSGFIVSSSFTSNYLSDRGFNPSSITIIEPAPTCQPQIERKPVPKVHALILGNCIPRKGQLRFLQALVDAHVPPDYILTIAGGMTADREYAQRCTEIILKNRHLKKCVRMLGEQDTRVIQQLYDQANLYVSASEMETFGMSIQDAVVCGLPVLACEGGYAAEHVSHGNNGYRCTTIDQLAAEFLRCVTDFDHFLSLQERAKTFSPSYHTWDQGANTLLDAYYR